VRVRARVRVRVRVRVRDTACERDMFWTIPWVRFR
jgi:hypothetical protein